MIAAALASAGGERANHHVLELGRLAGIRFDEVKADGDCVVAAAAPAVMTARGTAAWVGCSAPADPASSPRSHRGPFALATAQRGLLLLGRGRVGGHALYYARAADGAVVACTRLDPLVRLLRIEVDAGGLARLLLGIPSDVTPYRGVRRLGPAELRFLGPTNEERVALLEPVPAPRPSADVREVAEELLRLTSAAVARAVGSDERIVVSVGGLDSSGILALLLAGSRGASPKEVTALTLHFAGLDDDRPYVRDLCRAMAIEPVRMPPAAWARHVLDPIALDAWPNTRAQTYFAIGVGTWTRAHGAGTVLTGEGGDALFDGDLGVFARGGLRRVRDACELKGFPYLGSTRRRVATLALRPRLRRLLPALPRALRRARIRRTIAQSHGWVRPSFRRLLEEHRGADRARDAQAWTTLDNREFLDRCGVQTGCRFAQPYYDEELVAFVESLPPHLLFHGGWRRGLYRFAFRDLLPPSVRLRPWKSGFGHAIAESFLAAGGGGLIAPYLPLARLADLGIVDPHAFRGAAERLVRDPVEPSQWVRAWPAIALEAFLARRVAS